MKTKVAILLCLAFAAFPIGSHSAWARSKKKKKEAFVPAPTPTPPGAPSGDLSSFVATNGDKIFCAAGSEGGHAARGAGAVAQFFCAKIYPRFPERAQSISGRSLNLRCAYASDERARQNIARSFRELDSTQRSIASIHRPTHRARTRDGSSSRARRVTHSLMVGSATMWLPPSRRQLQRQR